MDLLTSGTSTGTLTQRVEHLEVQMARLLHNTITSHVKIPKGWISMQQFEKKYDFILAAALAQVIKESPAFFADHAVMKKRSYFVNPIQVCIFFRRKLCSSTRHNNQYKKWKQHNQELKSLDLKAKMHIEGEMPHGTSM